MLVHKIAKYQVYISKLKENEMKFQLYLLSLQIIK